MLELNSLMEKIYSNLVIVLFKYFYSLNQDVPLTFQHIKVFTSSP